MGVIIYTLIVSSLTQNLSFADKCVLIRYSLFFLVIRLEKTALKAFVIWLERILSPDWPNLSS